MTAFYIPDTKALHENLVEAKRLTEAALFEIGDEFAPRMGDYFVTSTGSEDGMMRALHIAYLALRIPFVEATRDEYEAWLHGEWYDHLQEHGDPLCGTAA